MGQIILGTSSILPSKLVEKLVLGADVNENRKVIHKLHHIESPYRIARGALNLNNAGQFKEFYSNELSEDLIENGALDTKSLDKIKNYSFEVLAGFVFESFVSRRINSYNQIKRNILEWILSDEIVKNMGLDNIKGIVIGAISTKGLYPDLYSGTNPNIDILFLHENRANYPPVIDQYNRYAGVQVKAIKTNYKNQIVRKVIFFPPYSIASNMLGDARRYPIYRRVLILLKDDSGIHSYELCKDILYKEYKDILNRNQIEEAMESIISPEKLGLDQEEIDYYYDLIRQWHANPKTFKLNQLGVDSINSIKILNSYVQNFNNNLPFRKNIIIPN